MSQLTLQARRDSNHFVKIVFVNLPQDGVIDGLRTRDRRQAGDQREFTKSVALRQFGSLDTLSLRIMRMDTHPARFDQEQCGARVFLVTDQLARRKDPLLDITDYAANLLRRQADHQVQYREFVQDFMEVLFLAALQPG